MFITPLILQTICNDLVSSINGLKTSFVVVDDSQLENFLKELEDEQNNVLIGIIPQYKGQGDFDNARLSNPITFMCLHRTNSKDIDHQDFVQILNDAALQCYEIYKYFLYESEDNQDYCNITNNFLVNSVNIYPMWWVHECNGYAIDVEFLTNL